MTFQKKKLIGIAMAMEYTSEIRHIFSQQKMELQLEPVHHMRPLKHFSSIKKGEKARKFGKTVVYLQ